MDKRQTIILLAVTHLIVALFGYSYAQLDQGASSTPDPALTGTHQASTHIAAVSADGEGVLGTVTVQIEPGRGRTLLDTSPFIETDAQQSAKTARQVAAAYTNVSLTDRNVEYSFNISSDVLGGPSAGAAMTVATIAAIQEQDVPEDRVITGTIEEDSSIGQVGGVLSKAYAAGREGSSRFIVPQGQEQFIYYEEVLQENRYRGMVFEDISYVPRRVSINNLTTTEFSMQTREAATVEEAVELMLR